jgi:signal transduction histidine kinase
MGLKIMRYRAGMIGASFDAHPNSPHGTVITVIGQQLAGVGALESVRAL